MLQPSTRELIGIGGSKYAVVVAVSKRVRAVSEKRKSEETYRLSSIVSEVLDDLMAGDVVISSPAEEEIQEEGEAE